MNLQAHALPGAEKPDVALEPLVEKLPSPGDSEPERKRLSRSQRQQRKVVRLIAIIAKKDAELELKAEEIAAIQGLNSALLDLLEQATRPTLTPQERLRLRNRMLAVRQTLNG